MGSVSDELMSHKYDEQQISRTAISDHFQELVIRTNNLWWQNVWYL